ncbi:glycosyltransferase [Nocardia sp. NPDC049737]|uniref:glycosyltransferase n=1 Tax=Nocardia sp. NPDC049737 TaxID=3154358 RepID=UPI003431AAC7
MSFNVWISAGLVETSISHLVSIGFLASSWRRPMTRRPSLMAIPVSHGVGAATACVLGCDWFTAAAIATIGMAATAIAIRRWSQFRVVGMAVWISFLLMIVSQILWGTHFLILSHTGMVTWLLLIVMAVAGLIVLPAHIINVFEHWEVLLRQQWTRRAEPLADWKPDNWPSKISIHVPTHAEPPDLVIETLNVLSQLRYADFEVLVIDNNTADETLWRPVEEHCRRLGPKFRFLHVMGITGAKAGALNWALQHTDPTAELVAVVDADYHVDPDWLKHTVGFFDDPEMGFVQCPHAYRDYSDSVFGRMANAEYAMFFQTSMVSLDEHGSGLTVGTMSLIRRNALLEAGGWAEWCLTEDSELAIRIHALGYRSVYLTKAYGRGLIPETYAGYKKQRFRWTYGPVQEFRTHWRLFVPGPARSPSALTVRQRMHHAVHGLSIGLAGLQLVLIALSIALIAAAAWNQDSPPLLVPAWTALIAMAASRKAMRALTYRHVRHSTWRQAAGGEIATAALTCVIAVAAFAADIGLPAHWQRTNKFRSLPSGSGALRVAAGETVLGIISLSVGIGAIIVASPGLTLAIAIGLINYSMFFLASPVIAVIADRDLRRKSISDSRHSHTESVSRVVDAT